MLELGAGSDGAGGGSVPEGEGDGADDGGKDSGGDEVSELELGGEGVGVGDSDGDGVSEEGVGVSARTAGKVIVTPLTTPETIPPGGWSKISTSSPTSMKRGECQSNVTRTMGSHTENVVGETTMKGGSGWQNFAIQPLLVGGRPPEAGGCRREMSEDEVGQQDEGEKAVHLQALSALFISFKGGLW